MLTSFFSKSKPINFIIVSILIAIGYFFEVLKANVQVYTSAAIALHIVFLLVAIFMIFLLDFIIKKNSLTRPNNYAIFCFTFFLLLVPTTLLSSNVLISNALILFSLRRIFSLSSEKNIEKKILDASLYITVASFFYFYSILFLIVLFWVVYRKKHTTYNHLMIPFAGFLGTLILALVYFYLTQDSLRFFYSWIETISFNFESYNNIKLLIVTAILSTLLLWTLMNRIFSKSGVSPKDRSNYTLVILLLFISVLVTLTSSSKTGSELLFIFPALSIVTANYLEKRKEFWLKEMFLWLLLIAPILTFIL